jgi:predicted aspartyl protease
MGRVVKKVTVSGLTGKKKEVEALKDLAEEIQVGLSMSKGSVKIADETEIRTELGAIGVKIDNCETATIVHIMEKLPYPLILGNRFLQDLNADIDFKDDKMIIRECKPLLLVSISEEKGGI